MLAHFLWFISSAAVVRWLIYGIQHFSCFQSLCPDLDLHLRDLKIASREHEIICRDREVAISRSQDCEMMFLRFRYSLVEKYTFWKKLVLLDNKSFIVDYITRDLPEHN